MYFKHKRPTKNETKTKAQLVLYHILLHITVYVYITAIKSTRGIYFMKW